MDGLTLLTASSGLAQGDSWLCLTRAYEVLYAFGVLTQPRYTLLTSIASYSGRSIALVRSRCLVIAHSFHAALVFATQHHGAIREVALTRNGVDCRIISGSNDGTVCVAELTTAGVHRTVSHMPLTERSTRTGVSSVKWNPDGTCYRGAAGSLRTDQAMGSATLDSGEITFIDTRSFRYNVSAFTQPARMITKCFANAVHRTFARTPTSEESPHLASTLAAYIASVVILGFKDGSLATIDLRMMSRCAGSDSL